MRAVMSTRLLLAFAVGVGCDLLILGDLAAYGERHRYQASAFLGIGVVWLGLALAFLGALALGLGRRRPGFVAIPAAMLAGVTVIHTAVLVKDVAADPTTHNLLPFEYLFAWVAAGVPAFAGAALARAAGGARGRG